MTLPHPQTLEDIRKNIDDIDDHIHALLMKRAQVIEALVAQKKQGSVSALRPAREAFILKRLYNNHKGLLPWMSVEAIWRTLINTFTNLQQPFSVHAVLPETLASADLRDLIRFHFGFSVPLVAHQDFATLEVNISPSSSDLIIMPISEQPPQFWWQRLCEQDDLRIVAKLPNIASTKTSFKIEAYVLGATQTKDWASDIHVFALTLSENFSPEVLQAAISKTTLPFSISARKDKNVILEVFEDNAASALQILKSLSAISAICHVGSFAYIASIP